MLMLQLACWIIAEYAWQRKGYSLVSPWFVVPLFFCGPLGLLLIVGSAPEKPEPRELPFDDHPLEGALKAAKATASAPSVEEIEPSTHPCPNCGRINSTSTLICPRCETRLA